MHLMIMNLQRKLKRQLTNQNIAKTLLIIFTTAIFTTCKHNQADYIFYAKMYCDCFTNNYDIIGKKATLKRCDSLLKAENEYYNAFISNMSDTTGYYLSHPYPKDFEENEAIFIARYHSYLDETCHYSLWSTPRYP